MNLKKLFFFILITILTGSNLSGQNEKVTQLLNDLNVAPTDTDKVLALGSICWEYVQINDYESALKYCNQGVKLGAEIDFKRGLSRCYNNIAVVYLHKADFPSALEYFQKALIPLEQINLKGAIATVEYNIGTIHYEQGNFAKAIELYTKSLLIHEQLKDKPGMARVLNGIGNIYKRQKNYVEALDYNQKAYEIFQEIGDKYGEATALSNLSGLHKDLGKLEEAINLLSKSISLYEAIGEKRKIGYCLTNMAYIKLDQNNQNEALDLFEKAYKIQEVLGNLDGMAAAYSGKAMVFNTNLNYKQAIEYGNKSLALAQEVGSVQMIKEVANSLWKSYKASNKPAEALRMHELYINMRDSIESEENKKEVMRNQFQYEYAKKEALSKAEQEKKDAIAQEQIRRKNQQRNGFIIGFALMIGLAGVSYRSYLTKKRDNQIISKEKARSEELLLNILPEETANELKEKGSSDAKLVDQVTVLFTDFKGFTALSEILTPKELVKDLHECFSAFDRICEKYGIEKIKTIGDAYMAAGGLPTPNNTHAKDVVNAAIEMAKFVAVGKAKKIENNLPFFEIRIGIHTGPVVAGIVGIKKFQYDIWGDTVNTASRMESSGQVGRVNLSQATYELLKNDK